MKNFYALSVISMTNQQFTRWVNLCWKMRKDYLSGISTEIAPCMMGEFWYNQKRYICDQNGIRELP